MGEPAFPDRSRRPSDADLARVLGRTKGHWDRLLAHVAHVSPDARPEWKYYTKKTGWTVVVRGKRRNVMYLNPDEKRFMVSFAFSDKAVNAAEESDLPEALVQEILAGPKYPEGRPARVTVKVAADLKTAKKLLAIKLES